MIFRLWIRYKDIFEETDTLYVSKVYGVKPRPGYGNLAALLAGVKSNSIYAVPYSSEYPEWYESNWQKPQHED